MTYPWWKTAGIALLIACAIAGGVSLATRGIERIHGSMDYKNAYRNADMAAEAVPVMAGADATAKPNVDGADVLAGRKTSSGAKPHAAGSTAGAGNGVSGGTSKGKSVGADLVASASISGPPSPPAGATSVEKLSSKTGELLQITAHHGIRAVVSVFDHILK